MNPAFSARDFRDAVGWFTTGVTVITARAPDGSLHGVTANSFSSISLDPPLVLWSLAKRSTNIAGFEAAGHFAVNVLTQEQQGLSARFAATSGDKWHDISFETW
ncbi:MAG TPA: flavin reductase family protein, partial [Stellaceae bacterium]|nr:flavin reductase family protein [Stellaceae bacterium]